MVHFSEVFVSGFFGFGRTYGASARFECDSVETLTPDWATALAATARWRARRAERATALHLFFLAAEGWLWEAVEFVKAFVLVPPGALAPELRGLHILAYVLTSDGGYHLYAEVFPKATGRNT